MNWSDLTWTTVTCIYCGKVGQTAFSLETEKRLAGALHEPGIVCMPCKRERIADFDEVSFIAHAVKNGTIPAKEAEVAFMIPGVRDYMNELPND